MVMVVVTSWSGEYGVQSYKALSACPLGTDIVESPLPDAYLSPLSLQHKHGHFASDDVCHLGSVEDVHWVGVERLRSDDEHISCSVSSIHMVRKQCRKKLGGLYSRKKKGYFAKFY